MADSDRPPTPEGSNSPVTDAGVTALERAVRELGPLPLDDAPLPDQMPYAREVARDFPTVNVFWPHKTAGSTSNTNKRGFKPGVAHTPVVYHDTHTPEAVVRCYLAANPQLRGSRHAFLIVVRQTEGDFTEAAEEVLSDAGVTGRTLLEEVNDDRDR